MKKYNNYYSKGGILKGQNGLGRIPIIGPIAKKIAYKVVANPSVWWKAGASPSDIVKSLFLKQEPDDNKRDFIYGPDRPETSNDNAYTWQKDIDENGYKNVKSYEGVINPYGEYVIDKRNEGLVKELAKRGYVGSSNVNDEYRDEITGEKLPGTGMYDDVKQYTPRFHYDKNGNPVITASDLYDFGKNYTAQYGELYNERGGNGNGMKIIELERKALNAVGQPYRLIQHNIPIRFVDEPNENEGERAKRFTDQVLSMSDKKVAKITNSGYIQPSIVKAWKE